LSDIDNVVVKHSGKPTLDFHSCKAEDLTKYGWGSIQFDTDREGLG